MNEVHVEPNESVVANEEFSEEESSGEDMDEAHESEGVDVANDEFREEHNEDNLRDGGVNEEASVSMLDLEKDVDVNYDPGLWGIINDTKRVMLVKKGPIKILKENDEFPKEPIRGRHFSSKLYTSNRPNGEKQERKWLVYSNELDKVFCFCCKLFKHNPMTTGLAEDGINDWHNLPTKLRDHEKNPEHNLNVVKWVDLQMRLKQEATIDKQVEALINKERIRWKLILARIIGVVKTLSRNSLPFRGSNEKIYEKNNGLFCQLIEFLAEFDPIMKDHLRRVTKVNWVSQVLQKEEIDLENAIIKIKELILFFEELREDGFLDLIEEGKELAKKVGIEPAFTVKRVVRRKKQFDEDVGEDANESQSPQEKFKVTYFYHIIDQALTSLKDRFEQFQRYEEIFGFLLNGKFKSISEDKLMEHCSQLQSFLEYKEHCDIYADELFQELRYLKTLLPKDVTKSIDILNTIKSYWEEGGFQTVWVTYRILLTIPVTVASAERSFSKLKLIKTYLRTTMSQERLSGLAMISIENEYLDKLNYDDLIEEFASKKCKEK
uniref:TTF-type domain-containing protein n=1 Tax=Fagus sylvatica TaxID=28930 RepID=A0A2N9EVA5_FAGSY